MLGLLAAIVFFVGWVISHAVQHPDTGTFWLWLGLILLALHETFGGVIAHRYNRDRF